MIREPSKHNIRVGCAGWTLPKEYAGDFGPEGTHLVRYAGRLPAVEINSSFYRPHKPATYAKWAASVPDYFQFAVKMPKAITHDRRLIEVEEVLDRFLAEATQLGAKLGPILVQLPPSLSFNAKVAEDFFTILRNRFNGYVALEPRHVGWFGDQAEKLATMFRIARVAADPALTAQAASPAWWNGFAYYRLHGSPRMYYSSYSAEYLETLSKSLTDAARMGPAWCIFDNTAEGAATANALDLMRLLTMPLAPA